MAKPTIVNTLESNWSSTTTPKTVNLDVLAGDLLVVYSMVAQQPGSKVMTISGGSLSWTERIYTPDGLGDSCQIILWTAVVDSDKNMDIEVARNTIVYPYGFGVVQVRGHGGVGAAVKVDPFVDGGTPSVGITTTQADSMILFASADWNALSGASRAWLTDPATPTELTYFNEDGYYTVYGALYEDVPDIDTYTVGLSAPSSQYYVAAAIEIKGLASEVEQEGFAFGDDNGNESSHTLGTQDSAYTGALGTKTLRILLDTPDDPPTTAYKLKYQKNGSGGYVDVPIISVTPGQTGAIEVGDVTASGNNTASTSWAVSTPNASTGDLIAIHLSWDDSTNTTDVSAPSGPNGETVVVIEGPTPSNATNVRGKVFYYIATGSWTAGTLTFTPNASEQWTAAVLRVPAGEFDSSTPIGASNDLASSSAGNPSLPSLSAGASDGGGRVVAWIASDVDNADGTVSGWTSLSNVDRGAMAGNLYVRDTLASDSESISSASGWTYPSAQSWVSFIYIIRPPADITNQVYVSASANVTAGGEATTARLTPPSGKSTSDFTTGRRWDNENGSDSIDIGSNDYTELEWVLTTQSPATTSDYFDFRVYAGDTALATYTVTPRWTIGTAGGDEWKTRNGLARASVKTRNGLARASIKTINNLD